MEISDSGWKRLQLRSKRSIQWFNTSTASVSIVGSSVAMVPDMPHTSNVATVQLQLVAPEGDV
jgi:hypothetical protein